MSESKFKKKLREIQLDTILASLLAIYERAPEWEKGYKAGAADMVVHLTKEFLEEGKKQ